MPSADQNGRSSRRRISLDGSQFAAPVKPSLRSRLARRPKALFLSIIAPVALVAAVSTGMASANACEPVIAAGADCNGTVSFTATAWNDTDATDDSRTNNDVEIQYSLNGTEGPFETVQSTGVKYAFNKANDFSFKDSFQLPTNVKHDIDITVQAVAVYKWGPNEDIDKARQTQKKTVHVPAECDTTPAKPSTPTTKPAAKITAPTCADSKAYAVLNNSSKMPVQFSITNGTTTETATVTSGSSTREMSIDKSRVVTISAPNMTTVTQTVSVPTDCNQTIVKPTAAADKVCKADASGWSITYDNSQSTVPQTFVQKSGDKVIDTVTLDAGKTQTTIYSFADNGVAQSALVSVTVSVDGKVVQTASVTNDCWNSSAGIGIACDTPAGSGALLSFSNTGQFADTFTVTRDGRAVEGAPFTLAPGTMTTQKLLRLNNNDTANITIMSTSGLNVQKAVTLTCATPVSATPTEVKDEIVNRPSLASTGFDAVPFAAFGAALLILGGLFLAGRKLV